MRFRFYLREHCFESESYRYGIEGQALAEPCRGAALTSPRSLRKLHAR